LTDLTGHFTASGMMIGANAAHRNGAENSKISIFVHLSDFNENMLHIGAI
jgi:hypothetical protein